MKYYWINLENADIRRNNILKDFSDNNITNHYRVNAYPSPIKHKRHYENACCRLPMYLYPRQNRGQTKQHRHRSGRPLGKARQPHQIGVLSN